MTWTALFLSNLFSLICAAAAAYQAGKAARNSEIEERLIALEGEVFIEETGGPEQPRDIDAPPLVIETGVNGRMTRDEPS